MKFANFALPVILFFMVPATYLAVRYEYILTLFSFICLWATLSMAWNILAGYAGQISFGNHALFGIAAYTTILLTLHYNFTASLSVFIGAGIATLLALLIGTITLRMRGYYFSLATLAFPLMLGAVFPYLGYVEVFVPYRGFDPINLQFGPYNRIVFYFIFAIILVIFTVICKKIDGSRMGTYFKAIRDDLETAESVGIPTFRYKLIAWAISAFASGVIGSLYTYFILVVTPWVFAGEVNLKIIAISTLGGPGTVYGPIIGSFILVPLSEILAAFLSGIIPGLHLLIYGVFLTFEIIFIPEGLYPRLATIFRARAQRGGRS